MNLLSFSDLALEVKELAWRFTPLFFNFNMDVKKVCSSLKREKCIFYIPDDEMIPKKASLIEAVKKKCLAKTNVVQLRPGYWAHNRHFDETETATLRKEAARMLNISDRTVERHLANAKGKNNCILKSQLIDIVRDNLIGVVWKNR